MFQQPRSFKPPVSSDFLHFIELLAGNSYICSPVHTVPFFEIDVNRSKKKIHVTIELPHDHENDERRRIRKDENIGKSWRSFISAGMI